MKLIIFYALYIQFHINLSNNQKLQENFELNFDIRKNPMFKLVLCINSEKSFDEITY